MHVMCGDELVIVTWSWWLRPTMRDPVGLYFIADIDSESGGVSSGPLTGPEKIPAMLIGPDFPYIV